MQPCCVRWTLPLTALVAVECHLTLVPHGQTDRHGKNSGTMSHLNNISNSQFKDRVTSQMSDFPAEDFQSCLNILWKPSITPVDGRQLKKRQS
jgi:hypothetical protein